jgi:hypothetical protein
MLKNKQIWIMLAISFVLFGLVFNYEPYVKAQQNAIHRIFITLEHGVLGQTYFLNLTDSTGILKDQISITLDKPTLNLNYSPPPGLKINIDDQICAVTCKPVPVPDPSGTSSVTMNLTG